MEEAVPENRRRALSRIGVVGAVVAAVLVGVLFSLNSGEQHQKSRLTKEAASIIAVAKRDLGLPFDEHKIQNAKRMDKPLTAVDFGDVEELTRRVRILAKQLASSGNYTQEQQVQIKFARQDAESMLGDTALSREVGRAIMEKYIDMLEAI